MGPTSRQQGSATLWHGHVVSHHLLCFWALLHLPRDAPLQRSPPFSLEIGTVGFYSRLSTYVSGQKALWQSHKGRSSSHQKTLVIMSQDMAGATAVHMRGILCLWCCVASSVTGGTQRHQGGALSIRQMQGGWYRQRHLDGL